MQDNAVNKSLSEKIALKLALRINDTYKTDSTNFLKIKYGLEVLMINITKTILILIISTLLNLFNQTLIIMISFGIMRRYAFGVHAKTSLSCTIITSSLFFSGAYLSTFSNIDNTLIFSLFFISVLLLFIYAPADTEARPLYGRKFRKKLKIKSIVSAIISMILSLLIKNISFRFCIIYGLLCESITITPIIYKLLKRRYRNYEQ